MEKFILAFSFSISVVVCVLVKFEILLYMCTLFIFPTFDLNIKIDN